MFVLDVTVDHRLRKIVRELTKLNKECTPLRGSKSDHVESSVGNNIILQYIALLVAYYTSAILRIAISYWSIYHNIAIAIEQYIAI